MIIIPILHHERPGFIWQSSGNTLQEGLVSADVQEGLLQLYSSRPMVPRHRRTRFTSEKLHT